jgi:hypothetical protein
MRLDGRLEPIDGLHHVEQLLRALPSGQADPERLESIGQLP